MKLQKPSLSKRQSEQEYLDHTPEQSTEQISTEEEILSQRAKCKTKVQSATDLRNFERYLDKTVHLEF